MGRGVAATMEGLGRWRIAGLCLAGGVLAALAIVILCRGAIINGFVRHRMERAFAKAFPGSELTIASLDYRFGSNTLAARGVTLKTREHGFKAEGATLSGGRWVRLLMGKPSAAEAFAGASAKVEKLEVEFLRDHYALRCARVAASAPGSEILAEGAEFLSLIGDEARFAANPHRMTRYRVTVPECRISGVEAGALLQGGACRARLVEISRPVLDALADRDKAVGPLVSVPLMVNEALAAIGRPLHVESLRITDGRVAYGERVVAGEPPGRLTFTAVALSAEGIANDGGPSAAIHLKAQGRLMDAGLLQVAMTIPLATPGFSLHFSGTLGPMDLTRLDAFLDIAERTRIASGKVAKVAFEVSMNKGQARGRVRAVYQDLRIVVLDKRTGTEKGLRNRLATWFANGFKIRKSNPDAKGASKDGKVDYRRKPEDTFFQVAWFSLRSGVLDVIDR